MMVRWDSHVVVLFLSYNHIHEDLLVREHPCTYKAVAKGCKLKEVNRCQMNCLVVLGWSPIVVGNKQSFYPIL